MIDKSKLSAALRSRFKTPGEALKALGLGLDGSTLNEPGAAGGLSGEFAAQILDHLAGKMDPEHMAEFGLFLERLLGDAKVAANDDEAPGHAAFSDFLRGAGLGEQFVRKAVDMLPKPATRGGIGGRASDRRPAMDAADDFDVRFGGSHITFGSGSPSAAGMAFDAPPSHPSLTDAEMSDFDARFGGSHIVC